MRPVVLLLAVLAMLLSLGPGSHAHADGMGSDGAMVSAHDGAGDCAPPMTPHGKADKQHAGGGAKLTCCLGTICMSAGLPATIAVMPMSATAPILSGATASLAGRDVAPPLDPPRPFA